MKNPKVWLVVLSIATWLALSYFMYYWTDVPLHWCIATSLIIVIIVGILTVHMSLSAHECTLCELLLSEEEMKQLILKIKQSFENGNPISAMRKAAMYKIPSTALCDYGCIPTELLEALWKAYVANKGKRLSIFADKDFYFIQAEKLFLKYSPSEYYRNKDNYYALLRIAFTSIDKDKEKASSAFEIVYVVFCHWTDKEEV